MEIKKKKKKKGDLLFWNEISRMALLQVGSCCFCCSFYCWASLNLNLTEENTCPPGRELIFFLLLFFSFPFFLPSLFMERSRSKKEITRQLVRRERERDYTWTASDDCSRCTCFFFSDSYFKSSTKSLKFLIPISSQSDRS